MAKANPIKDSKVKAYKSLDWLPYDDTNAVRIMRFRNRLKKHKANPNQKLPVEVFTV